MEAPRNHTRQTRTGPHSCLGFAKLGTEFAVVLFKEVTLVMLMRDTVLVGAVTILLILQEKI